ncbi:MAG: hypothetical protein KGL35_30140 [Bradyrhizobium sp.]|nr:hypothetical protein [Bradyrhizobium sp.]
MPYALILNTASKANLTGGAFADSLTANSGDSLAVVNYDSGGARILEAWGIDSDSVMEAEWIFTRPETSHDQQHGIRFNIPALVPGGAASIGAHNILPGYAQIPVFKSDAATITVSGTAADDVVMSWLTEYDDVPGVSAQFATWASVQSMRKSNVGVYCNAVASATPGAYGASRAINADDDRFHGNTYYAILGYTVQTQVTTISLIGPPWGGQRIGGPAGVGTLDNTWFFVDMAQKYNKALIPVFNSNDKQNILVQVADGEASTAPKVDFHLMELTGNPAGGQ